MAKKLTQEEFIERATAKHGGKYDYSLVEYVNFATKVNIICPEHGVFPQVVGDHLKGRGCKDCGNIINSQSKLKSHNQFMQEMYAEREDKGLVYDYTKTKYINTREYITITCKTHGDFEQLPEAHKRGQGCIWCFGDKISKQKVLSFEEFLERAKTTHGDKYDYSNTNYGGYLEQVEVRCRKHGLFTQTAGNHISGTGCPSCCVTGFNRDSPAELYIYTSQTFVGFGITNKAKQRHTTHAKNFKRSNVIADLVKRYKLSGQVAFDIESEIKQHFKKSIIDTGIDGFRTEALPVGYLDDLIKFIDSKTP